MPGASTCPTEADIQAWCSSYLRKKLRLKTPSVDVNADFANLGLDSAESLFFVAAIEDWLNLELSSETAMEHRTVAALARYISSLLQQRPSA